MNILLRFKQESNAQAYYQALQLQFGKHVAVALIFTAVSLGGLCIQFAANQNTQSTVSKFLSGTRLVLMTVTVVYLCCLCRKTQKVKRHAYSMNLLLDIYLLLLLFISYPLTDSAVVENYDKYGVFVLAWCAGIGSSSIYYIIANWWVRGLIPIVQIIYFLNFAVIRERDSKIIILVAVECVVLYLIYNYIQERHQRKGFLEQRKVQQNCETIKTIFDDICQGIMIIDQKTNLVYSNKTLRIMLCRHNENYTVNSIFSEIHVKNISPRIETLVTEPIITSRDNLEEYPNTLNDLMQSILSALLHPKVPEPAVTVRTIWQDPKDFQTKKNLTVKFTTSVYMEMRVIIVKLTDTTDKDNLLAAQSSSDQKSNLLSSVSHELRTPLNGSINFIEETLNDSSVPQNTKVKWLVPALRCNRLLLSLVNDILDFSQMRAGKLRLVFEPRNVVETAKECIELLEIQSNKKNLKLNLVSNLSRDSEIVITDHNRLRQVILNLLSNAVKFTFRGGVTLFLDPINLQLNKYHNPELILKGVRVTCQDTGIGISPENQKKLFRAFEKIELGTRAPINATGTGLGLLISNNLIQRLSPREVTAKESKIIGFESQEDIGTTFYFEVYNWLDEASLSHEFSAQHIELEKPNLDDKIEIFSERGLETRNIEELNREILKSNTLLTHRQFPHVNLTISNSERQNMLSRRSGNFLSEISTSTQIMCKCPKILIVDDDAFNLTALEEILSKLQMTCDLAFNGQEAIQKVKTRQNKRCCSTCQQYKVIFMDCSMPILNGFETSKILKRTMKDGEIDQIKIIACTAAVQNSDEDEARSAGMDEFCTKPIKFNSVKEKLASVGFSIKPA